MAFSSLQNLFDYAKRDRYMVTDAEMGGIKATERLDRNGHNIYSLEAMDIKNALEKTRAKWQPKDSDCPHADNITHDTAEVKSIAWLWRMIKSA